MIQRYYADVMPDGDVCRVFSVEDPEVGPPDLPYCDGTPRYIGESFTWDAPSSTSKPTWPNGADRIVWVEAMALADVCERAIVEIDAIGDAMRLRVIGDPTKALEYQRAEDQARPYAAAGYPDPAPPCVASWAQAKRWTNGGVPWSGQQAADDIIVTADRWNMGLEEIRRLRLDAKERIRSIAMSSSGMAQQVEAIQQQFSADLSNLMKGLT